MFIAPCSLHEIETESREGYLNSSQSLDSTVPYISHKIACRAAQLALDDKTSPKGLDRCLSILPNRVRLANIIFGLCSDRYLPDLLEI